MPPKNKRVSMVGNDWEHIPDEQVAEVQAQLVKTTSIDDASMSTARVAPAELRDLKTQVM